MNKDMIEQYFRSIVGIEPLSLVRINAGLSKAQKYFVRTEYQHCLLKVLPYKIDSRIYDFLNSMRKEEQEVLASSVASLLREFHMRDIRPLNMKMIEPYQLYRRYKFCISLYGIQFPHQADANRFVSKNKAILKHSVRTSMTHQDFRPENIIFHNHEPYLIDFETACLSDPYSDFPFCIAMTPDIYRQYSHMLIQKYFGGKVPDEFWLWSCFYCIVALQKYAIWKFRMKHAMVSAQAEHLYKLYDGFHTVIPTDWI